MSALTCWKDIANYLGKGVRTVQRYEREAGLPVRRPSARNKGLVFAWPEELDAWISKQSVSTESNSEIELLRLRSAVTRLQAENEVLRHELKLLAVKASGGNSDLDENGSTEAIWYRCATLLAMNKSRRQECFELTTTARTLCLLRKAPGFPKFAGHSRKLLQATNRSQLA